MTSVVESWPSEFGVSVATAADWVGGVVGTPAQIRQVLRNKLWGCTASFAAGEDHVVLKIASPPLFPNAHLAHDAAHVAAPDAVPELLRWEKRDGQCWSLFRFVEGAPARTFGADAVLGVVDVVAGIQRRIAGELPVGVSVVPAGAVAALLTGLDDQPSSIVGALDEKRDALARWGEELDSLVPLSLDHVDLHLGNALRATAGTFVVLDWEEAVVSCPLFSLERLRIDADDHGIAALAERAYLHRLLPDLDEGAQRRAIGLARVLAPLKLAYEARTFARGLGWSDPHSRLTTRYITVSLDAIAALAGSGRSREEMPRMPGIAVAVRDRGAGDDCRRILATLPEWFGLADANEQYIAVAETECTLVATLDDEVIGLLIPVRHTDAAAEIHLLAVAAPHRRKGVGRKLVEAAEALLQDDGVIFLQVKTLSARRPDDGYEETRAFYRSLGFVHLEEHPLLWDESNPALQMIKSLSASVQ